MLNIIIPVYGQSKDNFSLDSKNSISILDHVKDHSILSWSLEHIERFTGDKRYFFISTDEFISHNHIDKVLPLYTDSEVNVIRLRRNTNGMPCAVMMGIDNYNLNEPFLVTSADQYIDTDLESHLKFFDSTSASAGTIGFQSIHPKWSYAELDDENFVTRVEEKVPISQNALSSSYYFSSGNLMVECISDNINRGELINKRFYLAPCLNELIINNKKVAYSKIEKDNYFNFYSNTVKDDFRKYLERNNNKILLFSEEYYKSFNKKNINRIIELMSKSIHLDSPFSNEVIGIKDVTIFYKELFEIKEIIRYSINKISCLDNDSTICQFSLQFKSTRIEGIEILNFENQKISSIQCFQKSNII
ncbi:sugar phosphate nucleotidyltransferase [Prochlorococcus marinus]|uniref:sugar phosphate nucleotidyltransferase n=1 Tax=Prochlorococcus marinus TaxID=1219 RepID=UPI0022B32018|nr:sugar phosphate nucleotidyltransferase [Prochlorococcus marinus]